MSAAVSCAAAALLLAITYALVDLQLSRRGPVVMRRSPPDTAPAEPTGPEVSGVAAWMDRHRAELQEAATNSLLLYGAVAMAAVTALAAVVAWLVAGRVLSPLHRVTATARRISRAPTLSSGLRERIQLAGPADEVKDLADTFDQMLCRLDRAFAGQRRFVGDASHELRTPVAVSRAMIELAMRRNPGSPELIRLGTDLLEVNERLERLITGLLALTNAENGVIDAHTVDLADVAGHAAAQLAGTARARSVEVDTTLSEAVTRGDATLLERLAHNLIENAVKYSGDDSPRVVVTTGSLSDSQVFLRVSNNGEPIRDEDLPTLFEPFRRLTRDTRASGAGLGLSIAAAIVQAHQGTIEATARPDGGLTVEVVLPAPAAARP